VRLCRHKERAQSDKTAKALACYGLYLPEHQEQSRMHGRMLLRFVQGRPVSALTCRFLSWLAQQLESEGWKVLVLFWDNASWHVSRQVRAWIGQHNRQVKRSGGLRLLVCPLPKKSPWLNNIEPKWVHGKRAVIEPEQVLSPEALAERLCRYYGCEQHEHLKA